MPFSYEREPRQGEPVTKNWRYITELQRTVARLQGDLNRATTAIDELRRRLDMTSRGSTSSCAKWA